MLGRFASRIERDTPVFDVGAGQGRNALYLAERGDEVEAIDPCARALFRRHGD